MDHVPQAAGCPHLPIKVPFVVTERFRHLIFSNEECNAEVGSSASGALFLQIFGADGATKGVLSSVIEIVDFYQACCFFRLLGVFYSVAGKILNIETYVDRSDEGQVLVTTKNLLTELKTILYQQRSLMLTDEVRIDRYVQIDKIMQETQTLTVELQTYVADKLEASEDTVKELKQYLSTDLWMIIVISESAAMLRETILTAARQTYLPSESMDNATLAPIFGRELPLAPGNVLCSNRFRRARWCPRQAMEVENSGLQSRSVLFTLSSIDRKSVTYGDHNMCSVDECLLDSVDNDTYRPLHAPGCEEDDCPIVPADGRTRQRNAATIIERSVMGGSIPAICLVEDASSGSFLSIKSFKPLSSLQRASPSKTTRCSIVPQSFRDSIVSESLVRLCNDYCTSNQATIAESGDSEIEWPMRDVFTAEIGVSTPGTCLPYIAISHVWSQGLGNRRSNALPLCQLRRLQHYVDRLVPPEFRPMPFWIDTICVPLNPTPRNTAIQNMRKVYRDAIAVLVVDGTLTELNIASIRSEYATGSSLQAWQVELLMRIKASPWTGRLWTYQEACLARQLFFQVGGSGCPAIWAPDIAVLECHRVPDSRRDTENYKRVTRTRRKKSGHTSAKAENRTFNPPILTMPLEYSTGYLLVEAAALQLLGKPLADDIICQEFWEDIRYLSRQLASRTTSRLQDEAICLSTLLGLEPAIVMFDECGRPVPGDRRMMKLWEALQPKQVPAGILFCNRPTYDSQGSGWMVKSLLRDELGNWVDDLGCGNALGKDRNLGLLVKMGGFTFKIEEGQEADHVNFPWDVLLNVAGIRYRVLKLEATASPSGRRSSVETGKFGILMPQVEIRALVEEAQYRIDGTSSQITQLPSGLLVHILDDLSMQNPEFAGVGVNGIENALIVSRGEMVEFEVVQGDQSSSDIEGGEDLSMDVIGSDSGDDDFPETIIEVQLLKDTQKWWVG